MLNRQEAIGQAITGIARRTAERAALRGLLNSYLRETGIFDPCRRQHVAELSDDIRSALRVPAENDSAGGEPFVLALSGTGVRIAGQLAYYSVTGHHEYGDIFYVARGGSFAPSDAEQLIDALLAEVGLRSPDSDRENRMAEMRSQIANSMRRTALYLERALAREALHGERPLDYVASEQSLLLGHPFHPTPKSCEGFSDEELERYAPEMASSFPLHILAVSNDLIREEWVEVQRPHVPQSVMEAAGRKLGGRADRYRLHPVHPWQSAYLTRHYAVRKLMDEGKLVDLGPIGPTVYPTSSVRTVWEPGTGLFYKLPIHVRITNFIRENTPEQVRRTMDAARLVRQALREGRTASDRKTGTAGPAATGLNPPPEPDKTEWPGTSMSILPECGYQTVVIGCESCETDKWKSSLSVIYRSAGALAGADGKRTFVVASLLEVPPGKAEPLLFTAVRQSGGGRLPDWRAWLSAYVKLSLLPLLHLFAETGISLEAHVQNSLLTLDGGMPVKYYVRDLEGVSVCREQAFARGWIPAVAPPDSPVLYDEAQAWLRLQYYYVVNHLSALIHAIARHSRTDEMRYWMTVRTSLVQACGHSRFSGNCRVFAEQLLNAKGLPAKANFISRFQGRGETPDYVRIPNPIYYCGGLDYESTCDG